MREGTTVPQAAAGTQATLQEHAHEAIVHTHDHYHVTHVHRSDAEPGQEFEHRAHYHVHEHDHAPYVHAHAYPTSDEGIEHAKTAHIHDHAAPVTGHRRVEEQERSPSP
jgi:hypothetical protein